MRTAMAFAAVAVLLASAGCTDEQPSTDEPTPTPETTTTDDAGGTTSSTSTESTTTAETTTTTAPEASTTTAETTTTTVAAEPWIRPSLDGEWVEVAAGEPWVPVLVGEIDALPGGGYVTVTPGGAGVEIAERDGFTIPTVMWSPDGVEWFDGDPERQIERPQHLAQLAVVGDRVAVVDGADFSDHVPLAIGDPRTGSWDVVALDYAALEAGVSSVSIAANDDEVLVAAESAHEARDGMVDVVTWVVDPTTGTWETDAFEIANEGFPDPDALPGAPLSGWVDGRWILFAYEDPPGPDESAGPRQTLWTSSDGLAWSQADLPGGFGVVFDEGGVQTLAVGPMGAVAVTCPMSMGGVPAAVWYSADGLEWAKVPQLQHYCPSPSAVGDYGFGITTSDTPALELLAADGSEVYQMPVPFEDFGPAASSGDTLLVSAFETFGSGFWLYSPP